MTVTQSITPRGRYEQEPQVLLRTRRHIPVMQLPVTFGPILVARADADFFIEGMWVANVSGDEQTYRVCLVPPGDVPSAVNAVAWDVPVVGGSTDILMGGAGLLVPPTYSLQVWASAAASVNIFGWGWDIRGDSQQ